MPKTKPKPIPEIYKIYWRQRMGKDASTQDLTRESYSDNCFSKQEHAVNWVKKQTEHGKIFIIRNRKGEMIDSYAWKHGQNKWGTINKTGYYGGYKIGNPYDGPTPSQCSCGTLCKDPDHPCIKNILEDE